jgi:hypothetical protein
MGTSGIACFMIFQAMKIYHTAAGAKMNASLLVMTPRSFQATLLLFSKASSALFVLLSKSLL